MSTTSITYGREQLLFLGKKFLTSDDNYRLPTSVWCKIRSLGLETTKSTKRGKRGGKGKQKYLRSALLNARSIKNKATEINDFITSKELDLIFITETWLLGDGKDNVTLAELLPPNYKIVHRPRKTLLRHKNSSESQHKHHIIGGGIALVYRGDLSVKLCSVQEYDSFEYILTKIVSNSVTCHIATVYRPPPSKKNKITTSQFLKDFAKFLPDLILLKGELLVLGDFNFQVNNLHCTASRKFITLYESFNLIQHVNESTHKLGNTLDLILTRLSNQGVKNIKVQKDALSEKCDHYTVFFLIPVFRPPRPTKTISSRNFKKFDTINFKTDLKSSVDKLLLNASDDPNKLVKEYDTTITELLDKYAPLKTRTVVLRPLAPWYDEVLGNLRKERRKAEEKWRKTGLAVHKQIFVELKNRVTNTIKSKKKTFLQDKLNNAEQSQQALFKCMNDLLYKSKSSALPTNIPEQELPDKICTFFTEKIEKIQSIFTTRRMSVKKMLIHRNIYSTSTQQHQMKSEK